jgi:hypothetical protein
MKLKITCCYALYVIVLTALYSGNQKNSLTPLSVKFVSRPTGATDSVIDTFTGSNILQNTFFGGNAGN